MTSQCILHRGNNFKFEYLCEFLLKIEIVPGDQEELFDEKTNTQKSRPIDTVPLSNSFKKQKINLGIDRTLYMQYKLVFVSEKYTIKS